MDEHISDPDSEGQADAQAHAAWRQARQAELAAPDSWLGLAGLFWLEPGRQTVGSGEDQAIRLPGGPRHWGTLNWQDDRLLWQAAGEAERPLATDRAGAPDRVDCAPWSFFIVERDGRLALRLRDLAWATHRPFAGVPCWPYAPEWRIVARWEALAEPRIMEVPNVSGELKQVTVTHLASFEHAGHSYQLLPVAHDAKGVMFVLRDRGSGRDSYGAGRFLKARPDQAGGIVLDFNRAFNPPCAFTPFATCPLPPPENWLPFAIPAGEMKPAKTMPEASL